MKKVAFAVATGFLVGIAAAFVVLREQAPDLPFVETAAELPTASAERPPSATPRTLSEIARLAGNFEQTAALYHFSVAPTLQRWTVFSSSWRALGGLTPFSAQTTRFPPVPASKP